MAVRKEREGRDLYSRLQMPEGLFSFSREKFLIETILVKV